MRKLRGASILGQSSLVSGIVNNVGKEVHKATYASGARELVDNLVATCIWGKWRHMSDMQRGSEDRELGNAQKKVPLRSARAIAHRGTLRRARAGRQKASIPAVARWRWPRRGRFGTTFVDAREVRGNRNQWNARCGSNLSSDGGTTTRMIQTNKMTPRRRVIHHVITAIF
jgi:hypothetical protein